MIEEHHSPVLLNESIKYLITDKSGRYFDATLGFGGHSDAILNNLNDDGILVATDVDNNALEYSKKKFADDKRANLYGFNFSQIKIIAKIEQHMFFDGIFADLGVSSFQLDKSESGFTYRKEAELDLRMDKTKSVTAADVVNSFSEDDLAELFFKYGEERNSKKIAREIVDSRKSEKIKTTLQLSSIIERITPDRFQGKTLSRIFQALRIYVNDELNALKKFLKDSVDLLNEGGRIVIISYHSLEDRIVKDHLKYETLDCICPKDFPVCKCDKESRLKIITKKPVTPEVEEINKNKRSRSAKLRAAERI